MNQNDNINHEHSSPRNRHYGEIQNDLLRLSHINDLNLLMNESADPLMRDINYANNNNIQTSIPQTNDTPILAHHYSPHVNEQIYNEFPDNEHMYNDDNFAADDFPEDYPLLANLFPKDPINRNRELSEEKFHIIHTPSRARNININQVPFISSFSQSCSNRSEFNIHEQNSNSMKLFRDKIGINGYMNNQISSFDRYDVYKQEEATPQFSKKNSSKIDQHSPHHDNIVLKSDKKRKEMKGKSSINSKSSNYEADFVGRSSRGLRVLSIKVKDIVFNKKKTSYKEVAETLILEYHSADKQVQLLNKEEQNIKRRVYDALNVLIATDILKKSGKFVICDESSIIGDKAKKETYLIELKKIQREKEQLIYRKKKLMQDLVYKYLAAINLIQRNKLRQQQQSEIKLAEDAPTEEKIKCPFLFLLPKGPDIRANFNQEKTCLSILTKEPVSIYGDLDILVEMNMHLVSRNFLNQNLNEKYCKYLDPKFLENLKQKNYLLPLQIQIILSYQLCVDCLLSYSFRKGSPQLKNWRIVFQKF